ncbi:MAG TPA: SpoIIIAH-like family protein [Clostridiaceae bacterium]|nr:SpoIIIAH-like family protein [Clostridiaceae bacterium]
MLFQKKQIVVLSLVILIVIAGYLQYSYKKSSTASNDSESGKLGEAVYVDNNLTDEEAAEKNSSDKNDEKKGKEEKKAESQASQEVEEFFIQTKLSREASVSKSTDSLKAITEDVNASEEVKAQAYEKLIALAQRAEMEAKIEALIADAGFEDALVLFGEDGGIDIIVKTPTLTSQDVAKIADVASRHANVSLDKIFIKNKY